MQTSEFENKKKIKKSLTMLMLKIECSRMKLGYLLFRITDNIMEN